MTNLSQTNPTLVNGETILSVAEVKHCDVFTISDRSFRFEFAPDSKHHPRNVKTSTPQRVKKTPNKILTPKVNLIFKYIFFKSLCTLKTPLNIYCLVHKITLLDIDLCRQFKA